MPGTRLFFAACMLIALALVIAAVSGALSPREVPPLAAAGYDLWRASGCEGCHTLYGQGGAYAPDLTHIYTQRGETYLREFMVNPGAFHPDQRVMPRFGLTFDELTALLAFLDWVGQQNPGWPPRPIQVIGSGGLNEGMALNDAASALSSDPVDRGRRLFSQAPANCATCHLLEPDAVRIGPSLAGIAARAATRVPGLTAEGYIRESILDPGKFVVPGFPDAMARNLGQALTSDQINAIIAFLMTLK